MTELVFPELRRNPLVQGAGQGVLVSWLAGNGSSVNVGQRIAEVRDDGEMSCWVCALATGTLWHRASSGEVLAVGSVIGLIE